MNVPLPICHRLTVVTPGEPKRNVLMPEREAPTATQTIVVCMRERCALFISDDQAPNGGLCGDTVQAMAIATIAHYLTEGGGEDEEMPAGQPS